MVVHNKLPLFVFELAEKLGISIVGPVWVAFYIKLLWSIWERMMAVAVFMHTDLPSVKTAY
jgi:hypothetical protein